MSSVDVPAIAIENLSIHFPGRDRPALRNVTARIEAGEALAITGPSGCGKTTLLRTVAGFIPDMIRADMVGRVRIEHPLSKPTPMIGLVQQDPDAQVCTLRVRSEVAFGPENLCLPRDEVQSRVEAALEAMGIAHLAERDTTTLSGGEKQRLAVASILAMEPSVILLDEPTAHMDPAGVMELLELIRRLRKDRGCTLVIVEHRLRPLASLDPRLWVMDEGRLVPRDEGRAHRDALDMTSDDERAAAIPRASSPHDSLRVEDISFGYPERPLFDGLSFTLDPGTVLGVIGPNGGGKTTLLRLLAGLECPDAGVIVRPEDMRIGMVFQHPHQQIFERTVRRDLEIEGSLDDTAVHGLLDTAHLSGLAEAPPHSLSLGEQRRLTVLTAFRGDPPLLLLDEPFIGQDRENVRWLAERIRHAQSAGSAVCLVTHDIPMAAALCDRLLYLGNPRIEGSPSDVFDELRASELTAFTPEFWEGER